MNLYFEYEQQLVIIKQNYVLRLSAKMVDEAFGPSALRVGHHSTLDTTQRLANYVLLLSTSTATNRSI
jgi:hypothetical protein